MQLRSFVLLVHRWLGLASSVILAIVGVSGAIIAFPGDSAIHRYAGRLHGSLALGRAGWRIVIIASGLAVAIQLSGAWLWWKRKVVRVRFSDGWQRAIVDFHHALGVMGLVFMLVLAGSGAVRPFVRAPGLRSMISQVHTSQGFPFPVKVLYAAASMGFLIQGMTGLIMWWPPRR